MAVAAWLAARSRGSAPADGAGLLMTVADELDTELKVSAGLRRASQLDAVSRLEEGVDSLGNGSRVSAQDTVPLALWIALHRLGDYEAAVRHAVAAGGDTDTLAAMVGGIVGARLGREGIPPSWRAVVEPVPFIMGRRSGSAAAGESGG